VIPFYWPSAALESPQRDRFVISIDRAASMPARAGPASRRRSAHLAPSYQPPGRQNDGAKASVLGVAVIVLSRAKKAAVVLLLLSTDEPAVRQHRGRHQIPLRFGMTGW
jgi:hypothetical protein